MIPPVGPTNITTFAVIDLSPELQGALIGVSVVAMFVAMSGSTIKALGSEIVKPENFRGRILLFVGGLVIVVLAAWDPGDKDFRVKNVSLFVKPPAGFKGVCPASGGLIAEITTEGGAGTVTYELTDPNGESAGAQTLAFKENETSKQVIRKVALQPSFKGKADIFVVGGGRSDSAVERYEYVCK
jgi:hypothetical protein